MTLQAALQVTLLPPWPATAYSRHCSAKCHHHKSEILTANLCYKIPSGSGNRAASWRRARAIAHKYSKGSIWSPHPWGGFPDMWVWC